MTLWGSKQSTWCIMSVESKSMRNRKKESTHISTLYKQALLARVRVEYL